MVNLFLFVLLISNGFALFSMEQNINSIAIENSEQFVLSLAFTSKSNIDCFESNLIKCSQFIHVYSGGLDLFEYNSARVSLCDIAKINYAHINQLAWNYENKTLASYSGIVKYDTCFGMLVPLARNDRIEYLIYDIYRQINSKVKIEKR